MTKAGGLGDQLLIDGQVVSGDINSLSRIGGGFTTQAVQGINKSAFERIGLLRDGGMEFIAYWNPGVGQIHDKLSLLPTADVAATYLRGAALGAAAASLWAKQIGYNPTRAADGSLIETISLQANGYGIEWGVQLTPGFRTDAAATNGTSYDFGSAGTFGLQAWLHVQAVTGTSVTVKLQQSSDNGVGDAWADVAGGGFTAATAAGGQRLAITGAVERYLRVVSTGAFTDAQFVVAVTRNDTEVKF